MDVGALIEQLVSDGARVTSLCEATDPGALVPTCPGWTFADLVHHLGGVHRWATGFVRGDPDQPQEGDLETLCGGWPPDAALAAWFSVGHAELVRALREAPEDLDTWTWMDAPTPLAFWARRQAHETGIHRVDAESAAGDPSGFPAPFAADGIDELLLRFMARGGRRLPVERDLVLAIGATDLDRDWTVVFAPDGFRPSAGPGNARPDAAVRGTASDLYVWLWNRSSADGLERVGDDDVLDLWRDHARVTWS